VCTAPISSPAPRDNERLPIGSAAVATAPVRETGASPTRPDQSADQSSDEPVEERAARGGGAGDVLRIVRQYRPRLGVAVAVLVLAVLLVRNRMLLNTPIFDDGDFAANAILIDEAKRFALLFGNYSRVGFHHPGPAFLYVQGWAEWLLYDRLSLVPTPYNAHAIGILALNATLIGATAKIVAVHARTWLAGAATAALALWMGGAEDGLLSSTWMPDVYVWPFLLCVVATASVLARRWASLPWFALASGLLVHGHVSFVTFVMPAGVVVAIFLLRNSRQARLAPVPLMTAAALVALFVLPIGLHTLLHFPGEFGDYIRFARDGVEGTRTIGDVANYFLDYWTQEIGLPGVTLLGLLAAMPLLIRAVPAPRRRFLVLLLVVSAGATLVSFNYGMRGMDDLEFRYLGLFFLAVPLTLLIAAAAAVAVLARRWRPPTAGAAFGVAVVLFGALATRAPALTNTYAGDASIPVLYEAVRSAPDRGDRPVIAYFPTETWPRTLGLMEYSNRRGMRVCAGNPDWDVLVSRGRICTFDELQDGWEVHLETPATVPPGPDALFADGSTVVVRRLPPKP
jgi:hypothetical protein